MNSIKQSKLFYLSLVLLFLSVAVLTIARPIMVSLFVIESHINPVFIYNKYLYYFVLLNVLFICFSWLKIDMYSRLEDNLLRYIQNAIIKKMIQIPLPIWDQFTTADWIQRLLVINPLRSLLGLNQLGFFFSFISLLLGFSLLCFISWKITSIVLFILLSLITITFLSTALLLPFLEDYVHQVNLVYGFLFQVVSGITRIKDFAREKEVLLFWHQQYLNARLKLQQSYDKGVLGYALFNCLPTLILIVVFFIISQTPYSLDRNQFLMFFCGLCLLISSMPSFYMLIGSFLLESSIIYKRLVPLINAPSESFSKGSYSKSIKPLERLSFNRVSFNYPNSSRIILRDVSFQIARGEHIAFVGPSGSGKSTLLKIMLGFYYPQNGHIEINDAVRTLEQVVNFRSQMGVVLQDEQLIQGTLFEQIGAYSGASEQDIWDVISLMEINSLILKLPMGLHTVVSPSQSLFSNGEKQLLLIARALVAKPHILIFDEATNTLDNVTQEKITRLIDTLAVTRITIAHRLSTVKKAHRIYVLNNGSIEQSGTYQSLKEQKGLFKQLAESQDSMT